MANKPIPFHLNDVIGAFVPFVTGIWMSFLAFLGELVVSKLIMTKRTRTLQQRSNEVDGSTGKSETRENNLKPSDLRSDPVDDEILIL